MSTLTLAGPTTTTGTTTLLTSPTYTFVPGISRDSASKAYTVSALGGTQTGVAIHSLSKPKEVIFKRFAAFMRAAKYNSLTQLFGVVPKNTISIIGRGGVNISATQVELMSVRVDISVPAGAEAYEPANVEAVTLMTIQATINQLAQLLDASRSGVI